MSRLVLGLMGATALTMATGAGATVTLNTCTMTCTGPTTNGNETTIAYADTGMATNFTESLNFTNDLAGLYSITLTTSTAAVNFTSAILTDGVAVYALQKIVDDGTNEFWSFLNPPTNQYQIAPGTFTLTIMGQNNNSGSMGGTVTITQEAAVPEPATWAMMLLGFGAIGWQLRRRRGLALAQAV